MRQLSSSARCVQTLTLWRHEKLTSIGGAEAPHDEPDRHAARSLEVLPGLASDQSRLEGPRRIGRACQVGDYRRGCLWQLGMRSMAAYSIARHVETDLLLVAPAELVLSLQRIINIFFVGRVGKCVKRSGRPPGDDPLIHRPLMRAQARYVILYVKDSMLSSM